MSDDLKSTDIHSIQCIPDDRVFDCREDSSLLEAGMRAGIPFTHACGGQARCSTCRIHIECGLENVHPRNDLEKELSEQLQFDDSIRLACQTKVKGGIQMRRLIFDEEDLLLTKAKEGALEPAPAGKEESVAILFSDIRGFTPLSEKLLPYDVIHILDRYFHRMGNVIHRHDGYVNNYMGDGLMALFEKGVGNDAAQRAVEAGQEMFRELVEVNRYLQGMYHQTLRIGVGIHFGSVILGTVGFGDARKRTAIGDAVNFASRIESANKKFGTEFLISEDCRAACQTPLDVGREWDTDIAGKKGNYRLYEILPKVNPLTPAPPST